MQRRFDQPLHAGRAIEQVHDAGCDRGDARPASDAAEGVVRERARLPLVVMGEELRLVGGHVDRDWALALAGLATEAEIERLLDLLVPPLVRQDLTLHQLPEQMGPSARGMELLAGR